jgi:hypothetical protein
VRTVNNCRKCGARGRDLKYSPQIKKTRKSAPAQLSANLRRQQPRQERLHMEILFFFVIFFIFVFLQVVDGADTNISDESFCVKTLDDCPKSRTFAAS